MIEYHEKFYFDHYFKERKTNRTIGAIIKILFQIREKEIDKYQENVKRYLRHNLWDNESLLELFPLPAKNIKSIDKSITSKEDYYKKYEKYRIELFQKIIQSKKPKVVIFYTTDKNRKKMIEEIIKNKTENEIMLEQKEIFGKKYFFIEQEDIQYYIISHFTRRWYNSELFLKEFWKNIKKHMK